eukprot:TRINITY_DN20925_c0_g1_i1.p1 TRINITY_DN20925_c0_g1~~TRINITY_DN20925_c0_g1_i1.p1  ORF type:complete len:641 (-),score=82.89 TRINITY_DN20925_c0_g1_i1:341-2170(-)
MATAAARAADTAPGEVFPSVDATAVGAGSHIDASANASPSDVAAGAGQDEILVGDETIETAAAASLREVEHGSPTSKESKDYIAFRMCDVYAAPRLPHALAESWNPILKSADDLKFGRFRGLEAPGRAKVPAAKTENPPSAPQLPKRPRVPPAPRRPLPKKIGDPQPADIDAADGMEQGISAAEIDCSDGNRSPAHAVGKDQSPVSFARKGPPAPPQRSGQSQHFKPEPRPCEWCGSSELPDHPKSCKLRPVECKHCKQKLAFAALRQHLKTCPERPIAKDELAAKKLAPASSSSRASSRAGSRSGSRAGSRAGTPRVEAQSSQLCFQILSSLRGKAQQFQKRLDAALKMAMLDDDDGSQSDVEELEASLKTMAQELSVVNHTLAGSRASPSHQKEQSLPTVPQELLPVERCHDSMDSLVHLQRRLSTFQTMLRSAADTADSICNQPPKPPPPDSHGGSAPTGGRRPPPVLNSLGMSMETPRKRTGRLPPLSSTSERGPSRSTSRASSRDEGTGVTIGRNRGRTRERSTSSLRDKSSNSVDSVRSHQKSRKHPEARRSGHAPVQNQLRITPGPAATGYRDLTVEEMKQEIENERQRYIAQGLQAPAALE